MRKTNRWLSGLVFLFFCFGTLFPQASQAAPDRREIIFPILGATQFSNDFGAPRAGHTHAGNDIFAPKMRPLVAVVTGRVRFVAYPEPSYGYMVSIEDDDGYQYWYLHVNNDSPGTDDGNGGGINAYAPDIDGGLPVVAGQLIGWVGDSGNAESTPSHLHFEIHRPDGTPINPYNSLIQATHIERSVPGPKLDNEILPFGLFKGGGSVAVRNDDTDPEHQLIVAGAGPGGTPYVRLMDETGASRGNFFAYETRFSGGVNVAMGDVDGDGITDIVTAPGVGRQATIRVYSLAGERKASFNAYDGFILGVRIAVADLDGDGQDEIVTGPQAGGQARVRVFQGDGTFVREFFAYSASFRGGIEVAAAPAMADESGATIVTAPSSGAGPKIRLFTPDGHLVRSFLAYRSTFLGGVHLAVGNITDLADGPEILTAPASKAGPDFRLYGYDGTPQDDYDAFEPWWRGGYNVAINSTSMRAHVISAQGGRRASIRELTSQFQNWWSSSSVLNIPLGD